MNEDTSNVMAFDALYTNNQIQKLKVLLPYIDQSMQKHMTIYIKYLELKYTIELFKRHPFHIHSTCEKQGTPDLKKICRELRPYCTESENRQLEQMVSIFRTMEMYQEMSQTMNAMQEMFPDMGMGTSGEDLFGNGNPFSMFMNHPDGSGDTGEGSTIENILMGMLTPEQKAMYETFNNTLS